MASLRRVIFLVKAKSEFILSPNVSITASSTTAKPSVASAIFSLIIFSAASLISLTISSYAAALAWAASFAA